MLCGDLDGIYRQREGLHAETAQSVLVVTLQLVIGGLTRVILVVSGTVNLLIQACFLSHFLEANSWNCGSLCHGNSLVIM